MNDFPRFLKGPTRIELNPLSTVVSDSSSDPFASFDKCYSIGGKGFGGRVIP